MYRSVILLMLAASVFAGDAPKPSDTPVLTAEQKESIAWAILDAESASKYADVMAKQRDEKIAHACGRDGWVVKREKDGLVCVSVKK